MPTPREGAPPHSDASVMQFLARALADATSAGPHAPQGDLFDGIDELEQKVLLQYWKNGRPNGDGSSFFDEAIEIRLARLRKKARNETWGENLWLASKVVAPLLVLAAAVHYML